MYLKGHKSISMFSSLIPIHLLTTRLATSKHSAAVTREARVQAQEVGVINLVRFSQGDTGCGYLVSEYQIKKMLGCFFLRISTLKTNISVGNKHLVDTMQL